MELEFSDRTKLLLAESIKELMRTIPLDKITVKEIVSRCGTTRQTFYRNFKDKYDLVNWYFDRIIKKTIHQMGISLTMQEGLVKKFEFMREDKPFFVSALSSSDYNNLMDYDYECIYSFYKSIAQKNGILTPDMDFLIQFYCHGSMDMMAEWVKNDMQDSPAEMARRLELAMPEPLHRFLDTLSKM